MPVHDAVYMYTHTHAVTILHRKEERWKRHHKSRRKWRYERKLSDVRSILSSWVACRWDCLIHSW